MFSSFNETAYTARYPTSGELTHLANLNGLFPGQILALQWRHCAAGSGMSRYVRLSRL